jgi:hypothetical protein
MGGFSKRYFVGFLTKKISGNQSEIFPYNPRTRVIFNLEMSSSK